MYLCVARMDYNPSTGEAAVPTADSRQPPSFVHLCVIFSLRLCLLVLVLSFMLISGAQGQMT